MIVCQCVTVCQWVCCVWQRVEQQGCVQGSVRQMSASCRRKEEDSLMLMQPTSAELHNVYVMISAKRTIERLLLEVHHPALVVTS